MAYYWLHELIQAMLVTKIRIRMKLYNVLES